MKGYRGEDFEYRGFVVKREKVYINSEDLVVYDKRGNYMFRVSNFNKGSKTSVKCRIDNIIKTYGGV